MAAALYHGSPSQEQVMVEQTSAETSFAGRITCYHRNENCPRRSRAPLLPLKISKVDQKPCYPYVGGLAIILRNADICDGRTISFARWKPFCSRRYWATDDFPDARVPTIAMNICAGLSTTASFTAA